MELFPASWQGQLTFGLPQQGPVPEEKRPADRLRWVIPEFSPTSKRWNLLPYDVDIDILVVSGFIFLSSALFICICGTMALKNTEGTMSRWLRTSVQRTNTCLFTFSVFNRIRTRFRCGGGIPFLVTMLVGWQYLDGLHLSKVSSPHQPP